MPSEPVTGEAEQPAVALPVEPSTLVPEPVAGPVEELPAQPSPGATEESVPVEPSPPPSLEAVIAAPEEKPAEDAPAGAAEAVAETPAEAGVGAPEDEAIEVPPAAVPEIPPEAPGVAAAEIPPVEPMVEAPPQESAAPLPAVEAPKSEKMDWYILKVQSNREESIREGLRRRIGIAGLDSFFGDIIIPTEKVTEFKAGKRRVFKRKLYPGYLVVQMEINEDTWFLVRETPGIGDFTGAAGHPTPMLAREVAAIRAKQEEKTDEAPKLKINFRVGDHVKIKEGTFENFEGEVANIDETNGRVTVLINIFGRSTPVDIEYWQIEAV